MKIVHSKILNWGFLFFISLSIMFLFFAYPIFQKLMGLLFLLMAIISFNYKYGIEIKDDMRIRKFHSIFKYDFGKWEFLPPVKYILVLRLKQNKWDMRFGALGSIQSSSNNRIFQLNLIYKNNRKQKLISTNISNAEKFANELATLLNVEVKKAI